MPKYLNPDLVCSSFRRLSSRERTGKKHLERTSVLMYFLSFDATCKFFGTKILDFNPDSLDGKNCRRQFEVEFIRMVLIEQTRDNLKQVIELGKIDENGTNPGQRISSNFFSVPVKKSSDHKEPFNYPSRPPAPVLQMGPVATGKKWGIEYFNGWQQNLPKLLSEIKEPTPFLDLAIFICRGCDFDDGDDVISAVSKQLRIRFTKELAEYWILKMEREKIMIKNFENPYIDHYSSFARKYNDSLTAVDKYKAMKKEELIDRIVYLESILSKHNITH